MMNKNKQNDRQEFHIIGHVETDFSTKFGLPRQGTFGKTLCGRIVFSPEYRRMEAFKGLEDFSHLWVIWGFSEAKRDKWVPTVKPPRLGGKIHKGVFATRSPFRPNPIALTCVKIERIVKEEELGPVIYISGIDMMDHSPVYDIKPYVPYADAIPDAKEGFGGEFKDYELKVNISEELLRVLPEEKREGAIEMLKYDPRPPYHNHEEQIYKIAYAGYDIHFIVENDQLIVQRVFKL